MENTLHFIWLWFEDDDDEETTIHRDFSHTIGVFPLKLYTKYREQMFNLLEPDAENKNEKVCNLNCDFR